MLEKLAKQTAVYGISTIAVRFLSYLLTPFYTYTFDPATYGIVTDVYALIPFALVVLTLGMESGYFRFAAKADAAARQRAGTPEEAAAEAASAKRDLFASTWGATLLAAALFFGAAALWRHEAARFMGEAYVAHPEYVVLVAAIVFFDVAGCIPFSRLREQGRATTFVAIKALSVVLNVGLAVGFGWAGLYASTLGVGWVFVANLAASVVALIVLFGTTGGVRPHIDRRLLVPVAIYSLPLLVSGIAGTANEFLDRQMIKYLTPVDAMAQLGIYGAITKIAVVMTLFTQMYRLAAEPFFLADYEKSDFVAMNAGAMKYYIMASMCIFLGIALFRDLFALIVGRDFRQGIFILPVVLGANVLSGVWLNLSFWYKREERTRLALAVTFSGLAVAVAANLLLIPVWGYYGAAWARLASELAMVGVSYLLMRRYYPVPYDLRRMGEYVAWALLLFAANELVAGSVQSAALRYGIGLAFFACYAIYAVRRERIDLGGLIRSVLRRR